MELVPALTNNVAELAAIAMSSVGQMEDALRSIRVQRVKDVDLSAVDQTKFVTKVPSAAQVHLAVHVHPTVKTTTSLVKLPRLGLKLVSERLALNASYPITLRLASHST